MARMSWLSELMLVIIWSGIILCILIQFGGDQKAPSAKKHQEIVIKNAQEVTQIFLNSSSKIYGLQKKSELPDPLVLHDKYSDIREKNHNNWVKEGGVGVQPPLTDKFPCGAFVSHKYRFIFIKQLMAYSDEFFSDFLGGECQGGDENININNNINNSEYESHKRHLNQININKNRNLDIESLNQQNLKGATNSKTQRHLNQLNSDDQNLDFNEQNLVGAVNKKSSSNNNNNRHLNQLNNNNNNNTDQNRNQRHHHHHHQQSINIPKYEKQHNNNCMIRLINIKEEEALKIWENYFVFTVVRNPWIRALQTYEMLQRSGFLNMTDTDCFTPRENFCQHPHLLTQKCMDKPYCCEQHADNVVVTLHRQSNCLRHSNGEMTVDFVARAEFLEQDLNDAIEIINEKYRVSSAPKLAKLRAGEYSSKIEEEDNLKLGLHKKDKCISDIAWHYQDDIDFFGLNDIIKYKQSWELPPKQAEIIQWISQF